MIFTVMSENYKSNILKLYLATGIGHLEIITPIFVLFLMSKDLTMTQIFLLQSYFTIMVFLLEVPSGVFADLYGLKTSIVAAYACYASSLVLYGLSNTVIMFAIGETLFALSWSLSSGADSALMYESLKSNKEEKKFVKYRGRYSSLGMLSIGIASIVGGYLASRMDFSIMFVIGGCFATIGFLIALTLKEPKNHDRVIEKNHLKHMKEGFNYVRTHKKIMKYTIYFSFFAAATLMLFYIIQPYLVSFNMNYQIIGLVTAGYFILNSLGFLLTETVSNIARDDDKTLLYILFGSAVMYLTIAFVNVWTGIALILIIMFFSAIKEALVDYKVNKYAKSSHRATVLSIKNMSMQLMYSMIAPIIGFTMDIWDVKSAITLMGLSLVCFWGFNFIMFRNGNKKK